MCGCIPQPGEERFNHRALGKLMGLTLPITYIILFGGRCPDSLIPFEPPQLEYYPDQYKTSLLLVGSRTLLGCCQHSLGLEAPLSSKISVFSWGCRASKQNSGSSLLASLPFGKNSSSNEMPSKRFMSLSREQVLGLGESLLGSPESDTPSARVLREGRAPGKCRAGCFQPDVSEEHGRIQLQWLNQSE